MLDSHKVTAGIEDNSKEILAKYEGKVKSQLDGIKVDRIFEDKLSGKDRNRPQLDVLLSVIREGDIIHIHSMDRLARNTRDLLNLVKEITDKGAKVIFHTEHLSFEPNKNDPYQQLMMTILGAVSQLERALILQRQKEGIAIAKLHHRYKGGRKKLSAEQVGELKELAKNNSISSVAKRFGISRPTAYKYLK